MKRVLGLIVALLVAVPAWAQEELTVAKIYLGTPTLSSGSGSPEGAIAAPVGSTWWRTDTATIYLKTAGTGNTGWSAVTAAPYTAGDLLYASDAATLARLADVGAGALLASNSGTPGWATSPTVTGTLTADTSVSTPTLTHSANLALSPTDDVVMGPAGDDVLPDTGYTINLGALTNKYLTLHAAELWVETLVAQNTIATIGGRVLVGPTTVLTSDFASGATSIIVKHNQMASGDRVYLEADGKVEFIAVTSGASGSGPYTYSVTRNLDGSGANDWYAGDAVFNTGTTGDGFIDLYSVSAVNGPTVYGPSIVGNVRTGTTYSDIAPRWAIGNLNGMYGYGADTYGAAFGDFANSYLTVDATNGIRMIGDAGTMFAMDAAGNATYAGRLTVGTGRNLLSNTEFRREPTTAFGSSSGATGGTDGPATGIPGTSALGISNRYWLLGYYSGTGTPVWSFTCNATNDFPVGSGACAHSVISGSTPSNDGIKQVYGPSFAASPGQVFEFSFYASRTSGVEAVCPIIDFRDSGGSSVGTSSTTDCLDGSESQGVSLTALANWSRVYAIGTAPANTVQAVAYFNTQYDGVVATPKMYFTRMYFGEASVGQTTPTAWAPGGVTTVDGEHLATDLVMTNTLHSSGATALATGTGFWLDATSTPTFRVGNPSGSQVEWDGTNLTITSANFTVDETSVRLVPYATSAAWTAANAYAWTTSSGSLGIAGVDSSSAASREIIIASEWTGAGDRATNIRLTTRHDPSDGPEVLGSIGLSTVPSTDTTLIELTATTTIISGEVDAQGISGDGSQRIVCIKADGDLGTCSGSVVAGGTCTCG